MVEIEGWQVYLQLFLIWSVERSKNHIFVSICKFVTYRFALTATGKEGNSAGTFRFDVFPKPFITDGCIGLSGVTRE